MKYRVPKREFEFVLREVLEVEQLTQFPVFEEATWEMVQMIIDVVAVGARRLTSWSPARRACAPRW